MKEKSKKFKLENLVTDEDLAFMLVGAGMTFVATGIYTTGINLNSWENFWDYVKIGDTYWQMAKDFFLTSAYTVPIGAGTGYVASKVKSVFTKQKI